jgi:hypothetical protein
MAAGLMTRDEEIRALAELLDLYRHWMRGAVAISRTDEEPLGEGFESVVVETEALDLWMAALDRTVDRLKILTTDPEFLGRIAGVVRAAARPATVPGAGRPDLRVVT